MPVFTYNIPDIRNIFDELNKKGAPLIKILYKPVMGLKLIFMTVFIIMSN